MGFVDEFAAAKQAARKVRKEATASQLVAKWEEHLDLVDLCEELRKNHPDLPHSQSHVRKILRENGIITTVDREFNLIKCKPRPICTPNKIWYSRRFKLTKAVNDGYREIRKRFGDSAIPWEQRPENAPKGPNRKQLHKK